MTFPFPIVPSTLSAPDPYWANVVLLLGGNGLDYGTSIADESSANHSITLSGSIRTRTLQKKFGTASLGFQHPYVLAETSTEAFTIEASIRATSIGSIMAFMGVRGSMDAWSFLVLSNGALEFGLNGNYTTSSASAISAGVWYDVAIDRDASGVVRLYRNGTMIVKKTGVTGAMPTSDVTAFGIGSGAGDSSNFPYTGYVDEVRLTKGVARYASDAGYTPLGTTFPRGVSDTYWSNVTFVSSFEGANNGTTFTDDSLYAATITAVSAITSTAQFRFGSSSAYFNGSARLNMGTAVECLTLADHSDWCLAPSATDTFTIEFFIYTTVFNGHAMVMGQRTSNTGASNDAWNVQLLSSGALEFEIANSGGSYFIASATGQIALNTWYHIAISKDAAGKIRLFKDGTLLTSSTPANSYTSDSTNSLCIGRASNGVQRAFRGFLDEIRITKGVCRYSSDAGFTAPTTAFPRS